MRANALDAKYGQCTLSIKYWWDNNTDLIRIYQDHEIIVLNYEEYKFSDIEGVDYQDSALQDIVPNNASDPTPTTSKIVGRSIVGGLIGGGVGAAIGAATAFSKRRPDPFDVFIPHMFDIFVRTRIPERDVVTLHIGNNPPQFEAIMHTLNILLDYNKRKQPTAPGD